MKKIFSYSLFEPKILPSHRDWDKWAFDKERYWFNIPTIILLNKILYPEYETCFYISPNILDNPLFEIFNCFDDIKYEVIDREYQITEPAIWRMIPLWERGVSVFHARDVDSLTNEFEYKYIKVFENSEATVGTIRSHENHHGIMCRMLAGLCSFKPNKISPEIKGMNFDFYYSKRKNKYGSDQDLLIETFTSNQSFTDKNFLDCKIQKQSNRQDFPCIEANLLDVVIEEQHKKILNKLKKGAESIWLGEPCDSRGEILNYLLEYKKEYKDKILNNKILREFYII